MGVLNKIRPVWAEINLDNLVNNIREVRRVTDKEAIVTAVVKADGYGHGAKEVGKIFLENGADRLAVATLSEAIELRKGGIDCPILVLGYTPNTQGEDVLKYNIIQTLYSYEDAYSFSKEATKKNKNIKIHIKIDTGMGRLGFLCNDESIDEIFKISKLPFIEIEGIFTHFAMADGMDKEVTEEQYKKFKSIIEKLETKGLNIPIKHVANSASIIDLPSYSMDMVRAGIMLYGLYPSDYIIKKNVNLVPAMTLKARLSNIKKVEKGTGISYGHVFISDKEMIVGTIPIGYADGYSRMLTNKAYVTVKGKKVPIIGRICMDQCMVDLSDIEEVNIGDEVILFGYGDDNIIHIDEIANLLGTINYEVVCMIGKRVPRVYIKDGEIINIIDYLLE